MKQAVAEKREPIASGYEVFRANPQSQPDYKMRGPLAMVGRNPTVGQGDYDFDANAAYQLAMMWSITGDRVYAEKSKEIVNSWSATLKSITGRDAVLMAGLGPFKMVNAAEILRYTDAGWSQPEIEQTINHFREVIYPVIKDFAPFANGNWDTAAIKTVMAIGVFCDDRVIFERALRYYVNGVGNGRLTHYVINEAGQCQESGRDQQHTQLGLALLGDCCEIAWNQGIDLYSYADNRLLKGFEYTAKYNLGEEVPFVETLDQTGKYHHTKISPDGRGRLRAVFEQIANHYVNRRGIAAPYTQRAAEQIRPEGTGAPGADHVGFGTLLFSRPPSSATSARIFNAPGGVIAVGSPAGNKLTWIAAVGAKNYSIKRATKNEAFKVIARNIDATTFLDTKVKAGEIYRYVVFVSNAAGGSPESFPVSVSAGLPKPWTNRDVGAVSRAGGASFDGQVLALQSAGTGVGSTGDGFQWASQSMNGDCTLVARFVPQTGSQVPQMGLMMRESAAPDAAHVALLLGSERSGQIEAPGWNVRLVNREKSGVATSVRSVSQNLAEPIVTHGRLTGFCWLKLERSGDTFAGSYSTDGRIWTLVGTATLTLPRKLSVGLGAASRIAAVTTTVMFDNIAASNSARKITASTVHRIQSPDGKVAVSCFLQAGGVPSYRVEYGGKPFVLGSRLGLLPDFTSGFEIVKVSSSSHSSQWTQVYGERKVVPDNYRELNVDLKQASGRLMRVTFRAYNEGAAFRYAFPPQEAKEFRFSGEQSEFHFPECTLSYEEHGTEGEYQRVKVSEMQPWVERPLTLEYANGLFASLCEASNQNYPRMLLSAVPGAENTLVSTLGGTTANTARERLVGNPAATLRAGDSTPWRLLIVGEKPGDLLERNYLIPNLNPPLALRDVSWIKPGKVMRDTRLNTANSRAIMDLAAKAGLQYVLLDARWYGSEDAQTGDATMARVPNLDIQEIVRYGREKNVGLILYVDRRQVEKQRDVLFPLFEKWGVKGIKLGFVAVGSQTATAWISETIQKAAQHHLLVNIHDGYRDTGFARTFPNLLTVEGIRGNENFPTAQHNCTLPFTRYIGGAGDYTICYYDTRLKVSHGHQLAVAVVAYSPLQALYWYDRPEMFGDEPELEFFRQVPTVWDETRVINGEIGQFATIARRSGNNWFLGSINANQARTLSVPLSFLAPNQRYTAHIYADDEAAPTKTHISVTTREVDARTLLEIPLGAVGGQAVWISRSN